ncbi:MAG: pilus assembly protein TadG-related protein [Novosphingobium sp.]|nr:pilus assembly protein TadG-related protein [Novosphingobium sp.]
MTKVFGNLFCDTKGNVLPIAAAGLMVSVAIVGGGIDMSRAYKAENRLQSACDAAVLAGRKNVSTNGFDSNAESQADAYFATNFNNSSEQATDTVFTPSSADNGASVDGVATTKVASTIMKVFGVDGFDLAVGCSASMGVGNSDVVMVLDNTGSMGSTLSGTSQTRIQALRAAMKDFYDTLQTATTGTNARIRYGFVPYSSAVNVGQLIYDVNPDYLVDAWPIQSKEAVFETVVNQEFDHWDDPTSSTSTEYDNYDYDSWSNISSTKYNSKNACKNGLPSDTAWADTGSPTITTSTFINGSDQQVTRTTTTQEQEMTDYRCKKKKGKWRRQARDVTRDFISHQDEVRDPVYIETTSLEFDKWIYKQVTYDTSVFKTFAAASTNTGFEGSAESSTWDGCIEERSTSAAPNFRYSTVSGITPSAALDLDIDSAPDTGKDATKWAPMWPDVAYLRQTSGGNYTNSTTSDYGRSASSRCPHESQNLDEMTETEFDTYADSMVASGNTYLDFGMLWGARLSTPDGIFAANVNETPANGGEVSRHIIFMTDGVMQPYRYLQSTYGIEYHDRRVTTDGGSDRGEHTDRHTSRFLAICAAAKAKGIRIWSIAFTSGLSTDLTTCASDSSSYTANSSDELNAAFQEIAKQVGELRIIQ